MNSYNSIHQCTVRKREGSQAGFHHEIISPSPPRCRRCQVLSENGRLGLWEETGGYFEWARTEFHHRAYVEYWVEKRLPSGYLSQCGVGFIIDMLIIPLRSALIVTVWNWDIFLFSLVKFYPIPCGLHHFSLDGSHQENFESVVLKVSIIFMICDLNRSSRNTGSCLFSFE